MSLVLSFLAGWAGKVLGLLFGRWFPAKSPDQAAINTQRKMDSEVINAPDKSEVERELDDGTA
jgi:hypothetical protein